MTYVASSKDMVAIGYWKASFKQIIIQIVLITNVIDVYLTQL